MDTRMIFEFQFHTRNKNTSVAGTCEVCKKTRKWFIAKVLYELNFSSYKHEVWRQEFTISCMQEFNIDRNVQIIRRKILPKHFPYNNQNFLLPLSYPFIHLVVHSFSVVSKITTKTYSRGMKYKKTRAEWGTMLSGVKILNIFRTIQENPVLENFWRNFKILMF